MASFLAHRYGLGGAPAGLERQSAEIDASDCGQSKSMNAPTLLGLLLLLSLAYLSKVDLTINLKFVAVGIEKKRHCRSFFFFYWGDKRGQSWMELID